MRSSSIQLSLVPFAAEWAAVAAGFPANYLSYYSSATGAWTPLDFSAAGYAGVDTLFINTAADTKASTFHFHPPPTTAHPAMAATSLSLALSPLLRPTPRPQPHPRPVSPKFPKPLCRVLTAVAPFSAAPLAVVPDGVAVADVVEKDWSFLDAACSHLPRVLAAGALSPASRVLAVTPTASFVGALLSETPCELLVAAHESLYVLAGIKEEHDEVRCFHLEGGGGGRGGGVVEAVPERFDAFDAVFVCYFPGMGVSAAALLKSLAKRCSKGGRVVIFLDQGRQNLEQHRREHGDVVTTDLPSRSSLEKAAAGSKYEIAEFDDEPTLYLAVLQFQG